jgi:hypothetical protein
VSNLDPATADPRKLAEALRVACQQRIAAADRWPLVLVETPFAAALLAAVKFVPAPHYMAEATHNESIRVTAAAFMSAGGKLDE